jgi:hypothetical protein
LAEDEWIAVGGTRTDRATERLGDERSHTRQAGGDDGAARPQRVRIGRHRWDPP